MACALQSPESTDRIERTLLEVSDEGAPLGLVEGQDRTADAVLGVPDTDEACVDELGDLDAGAVRSAVAASSPARPGDVGNGQFVPFAAIKATGRIATTSFGRPGSIAVFRRG